MRTGSITHIKFKARRKTNPSLVETIEVARKNKAWMKVAHRLSGSSRHQIALNLNECAMVTYDPFSSKWRVLAKHN